MLRLDYKQISGFRTPDECLAELGNNYTERATSEGNRSILVGFSGGADSSFLLAVLNDYCKRNEITLYAAHVNHGIRGDEAHRDRDFCIRTAKKYGIKCFVLNTDIPALARETGQSIETAARGARYKFFADVMRENNIRLLATAHNADDNLETVLFRLARGTGADGLCGIPRARAVGNGFIVRPILDLTKAEITALCGKYGILYVYDSTNSDTDYSRNRIRALVVPELRHINPSVCLSTKRMCSLLRDDCRYLDTLAESALAKENSDSTQSLALLPPPVMRRVIALMYDTYAVNNTLESTPGSIASLEFTHLDALSTLVANKVPHSSLSLPNEITAAIEYGKLIFKRTKHDRKQDRPDGEKYKLLLNIGDNQLPLFGYTITINTCSSQQIREEWENIYKLFTHIALDSAKIKGNLFARPRQAGDKIFSCGMSKDVRKLFSAAGLPLDERLSYPVVCDGDGILWIPGIAVRDGIIASHGGTQASTLTLIFRKTNTSGKAL